MRETSGVLLKSVVLLLACTVLHAGAADIAVAQTTPDPVVVKVLPEILDLNVVSPDQSKVTVIVENKPPVGVGTIIAQVIDSQGASGNYFILDAEDVRRGYIIPIPMTVTQDVTVKFTVVNTAAGNYSKPASQFLIIGKKPQCTAAVITDLTPSVIDLNTASVNGNGQVTIQISGTGFSTSTAFFVQFNGSPPLPIPSSDVVLNGQQATFGITPTIKESGMLKISAVNGCGPISEQEVQLIGVKDDSTVEPPLDAVPGNTVAILETELPTALTKFLLVGTLPVPPKTYPRPDGKQPFGVRNFNGTVVDAYVETVARHPDENDGASVVKLMAVVDRDPNETAGRLQYEVVSAPHDPSGDVLPTHLIEQPNNAVLSTQDVYGNEYTMPLAANSPNALTVSSVASETRYYDVLKPVNLAAAGAYPHLMGAHAYVFVSEADPEIAIVRLRVSNAANGLEKTNPLDDAMDAMWFRHLAVRVPNGLTVVSAYEHPSSLKSAPVSQGGMTTYTLVEPPPGNAMHWMPRNSWFMMHLAICPLAKKAKAEALVARQGQAFVIDGRFLDSATNTEKQYWSWWSLAAYFQQKLLLHNLDFIGKDAIRADLTDLFNTYNTALKNGTTLPSGDYTLPIAFPHLGWAASVLGSPNGGLTGGIAINGVEDTDTAVAASIDGYRETELAHLMTAPRMANRQYDTYGEPTQESALTVPCTGQPWNKRQTGRLSHDFMQPINLGQENPWGYNNPAYQTHTAAVTAQGLEPDYQPNLAALPPHDSQHSIRWYRLLLSLAWLGGEHYAIDDLEMDGRLVMLNYSGNYFGTACKSIASTLTAHEESVAAKPQSGVELGRAFFWMLHAAIGAYATGSDDFRSDIKSWVDRYTTMAVKAQIPCSGILLKKKVKNIYYPNGVVAWYVQKLNEIGFGMSAFIGVWQNVYKGVEPDMESAVVAMLQAITNTQITEPYWDPVLKQTGDSIPSTDLNGTPYCPGQSNLPPTLATGLGVFDINALPLTYGYQLSGNPDFLTKMNDLMNGQLDSVAWNPPASWYNDPLKVIQWFYYNDEKPGKYTFQEESAVPARWYQEEQGDFPKPIVPWN